MDRGRLADDAGVASIAACRRWLLGNQLVDEITLLTYPMLIGQDARLFPDSGPDTALDLVDSRSTRSGGTIHVYRAAGRPQYATAMSR